MTGGKRLEDLPLEVLLSILVYLSPSDLTLVRRASRSLSVVATSNHLWQWHCRTLWRSKIALRDCREIPPRLWAFSLVANGWFRAYAKTREVAYSPWLHGDVQIENTVWAVLFKSYLTNDVWPQQWHALVECNTNKEVYAVDGLPLNSGGWYVDDRPSFRVSGYPPNMPGREPHTWCRVMQHVQVLMLSDSPEFLSEMVELDTRIRAELGKENVPEPLGKQYLEELGEAKEKLLEERKKCLWGRLKDILIARVRLQRGESLGSENAHETPGKPRFVVCPSSSSSASAGDN